MEETFGVLVKEMQGTHLFPLERPIETADNVLSMIKSLETTEADQSPSIQPSHGSGSSLVSL